MKYLKEITDWSPLKVMNHTYIFDGSVCVGYIKEGTSEKTFFKNPSKLFSKTRRKFKDVTKEYK